MSPPRSAPLQSPAECDRRHDDIDARLARGDRLLTELHRAVCGSGDGQQPGMAEGQRQLAREVRQAAEALELARANDRRLVILEAAEARRHTWAARGWGLVERAVIAAIGAALAWLGIRHHG